MSDDNEPETLLDVKKRWVDIALLSSIVDASHNIKDVSGHSNRNGHQGYHLHFGGDYMFNKTVTKLENYGFEIDSMAMSSWKENVSFRVLVKRTREPTIEELGDVDLSHFLIPDGVERIGTPKRHERIIQHHHC